MIFCDLVIFYKNLYAIFVNATITHILFKKIIWSSYHFYAFIYKKMITLYYTLSKIIHFLSKILFNIIKLFYNTFNLSLHQTLWLNVSLEK